MSINLLKELWRPFSFGAVFGHRQMIKEDTKDLSFATWPLQIWIEGQSTSIGVAVQSIKGNWFERGIFNRKWVGN